MIVFPFFVRKLDWASHFSLLLPKYFATKQRSQRASPRTWVRERKLRLEISGSEDISKFFYFLLNATI